MTQLQEIDDVLARVVELLRLGELDDWATALERQRASLSHDIAHTTRTIRGMYGGTGSLNDVVLFRGGLLLHQENDEFDSLRSELYTLLP
jgi:hypothetical protein